MDVPIDTIEVGRGPRSAWPPEGDSSPAAIQELLDAIPLALAIVDDHLRCVGLNQRMAAKFGSGAEMCLGRPVFHRSQRNWKLDYDGCWRATPLRTVRCAAGPTTLQWAGAKFIHLPSFATKAAPWQEFCGRLGTTGQGFRSAGLRQTRRSGGS